MTHIIARIAQHKISLIIAASMLLALVCAPLLALAAAPTTGPAATDSQFGLAKYGSSGSGSSTLGLGEESLDSAIVGLINVALGFLGLIAVIIILIGGFKWMTAGGNEDKVGEARKTIFAGIIGLAIILFAWGITTFVVEQLGKASGLGTFSDV